MFILPIFFIPLVVGAIILIKVLKDDNRPGRQPHDLAALQRAWQELDALERRVAGLEASVIERCGRRPAEAEKVYAENVTISKSN